MSLSVFLCVSLRIRERRRRKITWNSVTWESSLLFSTSLTAGLYVLPSHRTDGVYIRVFVSHLLIITASQVRLRYFPGPATCSVFAIALAPSPIWAFPPSTLQLRFRSLPGRRWREACRSLRAGSHTPPKICLSPSISLACFHLDSVVPSASIRLINSDLNLAGSTFADHQGVIDTPQIWLKRLVVFNKTIPSPL